MGFVGVRGVIFWSRSPIWCSKPTQGRHLGDNLELASALDRARSERWEFSLKDVCSDYHDPAVDVCGSSDRK